MPRSILTFISGVLFLMNCSTQKELQTQTELPRFDSYWDYSQPAETAEKFSALLDSLGTEAPPEYILELKTQLARTQGLQGNFDKAHAILDEVESGLRNDTKVARVRYLLERGRTFRSSGNPEASKALFLESWQLAKETGEDFHAVDAAHMVAIVESPEQALEWNNKAMRLAEQSKDPRARGWLGSLYNNIGWTYHDMAQYDTALVIFTKALEFRKSKGDSSSIRIAEWCIARTYRSLKRIEEALEIQLRLAEEMKTAGLGPDGYIMEELGECYLELSDSEKAKPYFQQAWELLSQDTWVKTNEKERLDRLKMLGGVNESNP